ncbi:PAS domain S-box-containing protein [Catenuloplanes nepalensis]|uniref:histidine kinase n=1 Tax=Catenuloplanes nepalensis TaxID=587533 RepID=A0ABT9N6V0_9ACTN|nr:chemotaxis protein CheB [Catenuloplanes nepalensis]MDP9799423.1 PAS domain S-box-containing protein [Catenuloplanes nepalensis]
MDDRPQRESVRVVALVTSAGGLQALTVVLRGLPADLPVPVVVQQHLGSQGSQLVAILRQRSDHDIDWARDGAPLLPGHVWVTPGRRRLEILPDGSCVVGREDLQARDRPHDALLSSLADSYGGGALVVVLTGMGRDGAAGVRAVKQAGGIVIAQSEDTAEQPSMPRAAAEAGADLVLPLHEIATVVRDVVAGRPLPRPRAEIEAARELFAGPGPARARLRTMDWSATALGAVSGWPAERRELVRLVLASPLPMLLALGPEQIQIANDAHAPRVADPSMQGAPARDTPARDREAGASHIDRLLTTGEPWWYEDRLIESVRDGRRDEAYFTGSCTPVFEGGVVAGYLGMSVETTERVLAQRRLTVLHALTRLAGADRDDVLQEVGDALGENPRDLPFALVYLDDGTPARTAGLAVAVGVEAEGATAPRTIPSAGGHPLWPVGQVLTGGRPALVDDLRARLPELHAGPWPETSEEALVLPLPGVADGPPVGVLIAGLSPRLALDAPYRSFLELAAGQIAVALAEAGARDLERQRLERLADLDRAKTEFYSNVSHEFRTPLTLMLGPLDEAVRRAGDLPDEVATELQVAQRNARRLLRMVGTLLDFSEVDAGRLRARFIDTDLAALTGEIAAMFRGAAEAAGLELTVDAPALPRPVRVDPEMWEKIVSNLLSNALKFTWTGGVGLTLRALPMHAELVVRDTGVGIPRDQLTHLFKRFHRVPQTRGRTHEGSGIGLALVDELVRRHHGRVRVTSSADAGTTVTVWIPLGGRRVTDPGATAPRTGEVAAAMAHEALQWDARRNQATLGLEEPGEPRDLPAGRMAGARVLVVDDNADMRDYLTRLLGFTWHVTAASDGEEALALARREPPDLVLADVMMPALDGFGLLSAIRADPALAGTPVVLVTARAGEATAIEGLLAGADDYVVKPFTARELVARVAAQLEVAGMRRRLAATDAYRLALSDALRSCEDPTVIQQRAVSMLARQLRVDNVHFAEVDHAAGTIHVRAEDGPAGTSFLGSFPLDQWGGGLLARTLGVGITLVVRDVTTHDIDEAGRTAWLSVGARAVVEVPLVHDGRWLGHVAVLQEKPREWTADEIALVEETAARTWAFLQQARAEAALRESERRFRTVADAVPALIWQNDARGENVFANRCFRDFTGLPGSEISGERWQALVHPDEADAYVAGYLTAVRDRVPWDERNRLRRFDGSWRTFDNYASPLFGADGTFLGHVGVSVDVTEQSAATAALAERTAQLENLFRTLTEAVGQTVWTTDADGRVVEDSPSWRAFTGQTVDEWTGWGWVDAVHPDDRAHAVRQWQDAVTAGTPVDTRFRLRHAASGGWHLTHVRAIPLRHADGTVRGWLGMNTDLGRG